MLLVSGQVRSTSGEPIAGAVLDIWMTNNAGDCSCVTEYRTVMPGIEKMATDYVPRPVPPTHTA